MPLDGDACRRPPSHPFSISLKHGAGTCIPSHVLRRRCCTTDWRNGAACFVRAPRRRAWFCSGCCWPHHLHAGRWRLSVRGFDAVRPIVCWYRRASSGVHPSFDERHRAHRSRRYV
jgi:hypothetical protein